MDVTRQLASAPDHDGGCRHQPPCPSADAGDRLAARIIADHPEQGWALRCNGVITFDDAGVLLPAG
ncbi:MAG TPA: DUF5999 family protein [Trebonia sp.]|nr:DUF5999 family protein [Trebonia sp.]